jgi:hypothetical protein
VHRSSALPDASEEGTPVLLVDWFVAPSSYKRHNYYHPRVLAPVIPATPGGAQQLPLAAVPAGDVVALELVVRPLPGTAAQVVLPANNDLYFMTAFGYEGPRL